MYVFRLIFSCSLSFRIFTAYGQMDVTVQEAIQDLLTPLIRSLGSSHTKLLTLMRQCPPGAETLALRVLTIFTEHGRPSPQLVGLVKSLINERDLDARFLIPIIAEMDKASVNLVGTWTNLTRLFSSLISFVTYHESSVFSMARLSPRVWFVPSSARS